VRGEVQPGDGYSTSSSRLPSQPGCCAGTRHAYAHAPAMETFYHTHLVYILASTTPVLRSQMPRHFARAHEHYRTVPAAATPLWTVPLVT